MLDTVYGKPYLFHKLLSTSLS
ncbi:hypothetical protein DESC_800038 [Desulfosarcina cetonica]|nr:hypothetical protein DESC_800038 [Desulfosarcina cetonica]